jgi:hypothetical protein
MTRRPVHARTLFYEKEKDGGWKWKMWLVKVVISGFLASLGDGDIFNPASNMNIGTR